MEVDTLSSFAHVRKLAAMLAVATFLHLLPIIRRPDVQDLDLLGRVLQPRMFDNVRKERPRREVKVSPHSFFQSIATEK